MLKAEQVPLEVKNAISAARKKGASSAEIAAAAINAWPLKTVHNDHLHWPPHIMLPLPQETRGD